MSKNCLTGFGKEPAECEHVAYQVPKITKDYDQNLMWQLEPLKGAQLRRQWHRPQQGLDGKLRIESDDNDAKMETFNGRARWQDICMNVNIHSVAF
jgi:hypothetical protein